MTLILTEVPITHDALRMRARRLCEKKASGTCGVPENINADYVNGGESREILEMALLQCLAVHGCDRTKYKKVKVSWLRFGKYSYIQKTFILGVVLYNYMTCIIPCLIYTKTAYVGRP